MPINNNFNFKEKSNLINKHGNLIDEDGICVKTLLELYNEKQELLLNPVDQKVYPLPYNAYNLDKNPFKQADNYKNSKTSDASLDNIEKETENLELENKDDKIKKFFESS